jgi:ABC-2 type transport system ATP-binding protein
VFSTHNVAEAERYADRVIVLADGELLFSGTPAELARVAGTHAGAHASERASGEHGSERSLGFEGAFIAFLRERGH